MPARFSLAIRFSIAPPTRRVLATLPEKLSMNGPIFDRSCEATACIGAEIQWCRLVFRTLRGVGSYVRDFDKGKHQLAYLTVGFSEASAKTAEILARSGINRTGIEVQTVDENVGTQGKTDSNGKTSTSGKSSKSQCRMARRSLASRVVKMV